MSSRFLKKARGFTLVDDIINISVDGVNLEYVCEFETQKIREICNLFHLPGHLGKNSLREAIQTKYVGIPIKKINDFVAECIVCKRKEQHVPSTLLTPIIPNFVRERLIVDTIDLSEYHVSNNEIKYIFTMIDSFSKFAFCYPVERKTSENFLRAIRYLYFRE
ncbi:hypothetical protein CDIK_0693 [Cucumispora dikerogammari]|nr:hypothetical protein CDIK_0693 [Cucumispora dikerogammari]